MASAAPAPTEDRIGHIDGLRALAILAVLLFHFRLGPTHGGFVGVDIFFVISGYLMTGIIVGQLDAGRFAYDRFMLRRLLRIAPALYLWVAATLVAGFFVQLPSDFDALSQAAVASVAFIANIHFDRVARYFADVVAPSPLLHLWSLGVEMQFYVALPLVLVVARRLKLPLATTAALGVAIGFAIFVAGAGWRPIAAFYLSPFRAWEFLAGAVAVLAPSRRLTPALASLVAVAALAGIGAAVVGPRGATDLTVWPVAAAVAATTVLLWQGREPTGGAHRLLAIAPLRIVGRVSYSTYLVHWPLLTLAEFWKILPLTTAERVALLIASLGLGALSWRVIEEPFRRLAPRLQRQKVAIAAVLAVGGALALTAWLSPRAMPPARRAVEAQLAPERARWAGAHDPACFPDEVTNPIPLARACRFGAAVAPTTAVWGDSHGGQLGISLGQWLARSGRASRQLSSSSCPPLLGARIIAVPRCTARNDRVVRYLRAHPEITTIVLAMRYDGYLELPPDAIERGLRATIAALPGRRLVIVGPWPRPTFDVPTGLMRMRLSGRPQVAPLLPLASHRAARAETWAVLRRVAAETDALVVDPAPSVCTTAACPFVLAGKPLYFDDNHPSYVATDRFAPRLGALMR